MVHTADTQSDVALMRLVKTGKSDQFAELVQRYQPALLRVARSRLGRGEWAEEAVQETFLSAFKSAHTYKEEFSFRTWLWTILLNQCRGILRRRGRKRPTAWTDVAVDEMDGLDSAVDEAAASPFSVLVSRERAEGVERLLAQLPDHAADALRLRFYGGLKYQEIADTMACSLGTAKNRVKAGLLKMAELMNEATEQ